MSTADREKAISQPEERLVDLACKSLDESIDSLDGATLSRLNRARQGALTVGSQRRLTHFWLPAGAATFAVLALAITLPQFFAQTPQPARQTGSEDTWISSAEDVQLVEDLDLVLWLMDEEDHAS